MTDHPPSWAESVLRALLRPRDRETVSGDLLEEYRETIRPTRGSRSANYWYMWQVGVFLWRLAWPWGLLIGAEAAIRTAFDTFLPPGLHNYGPRSAATTYIAVATALMVGFSGGYRTGYARSGTLLTLTSSMIGHVVSVAATSVLFFAVISRDPVMLSLFRVTGDWGEVLGLSLIFLPIVALLGTLGGLVGKSVGRMSRTRVHP
jgi:hypothetical protein